MIDNLFDKFSLTLHQNRNKWVAPGFQQGIDKHALTEELTLFIVYGSLAVLHCMKSLNESASLFSRMESEQLSSLEIMTSCEVVLSQKTR